MCPAERKGCLIHETIPQIKSAGSHKIHYGNTQEQAGLWNKKQTTNIGQDGLNPDIVPNCQGLQDLCAPLICLQSIQFYS